MIVTRRTSRHFSRKPTLRMCTIGALLLILIALGSSPGSLGAQDVDLSWSFRPGEVHHYRIGMESRSGTPGGDVVQIQIQTVRQEVLSVRGDGTARLSLTFEHVRLDQDSPLGRQSFDSGLDVDPRDPATAILSAMVGTTIELEVTPSGETLEVAGLEEVAALMLAAAVSTFPGGGGDAMREIFEGMVDESAVAPAIQPLLPGGAAVPGATWEEVSEVALPIGIASLTRRFTYLGAVEDGGRRVGQVLLAGEIGDLEIDPGHPLAAIMQMEGGTLSGESEIDLDRGILLRSHVRTEMTISALGQETRVATVQTIELVEP